MMARASIRALAACCAAAATAVTAASGGTSPGRLLVVAAVPPSYAPVALVYGGDGRLLDEVSGPAGASFTWSPDGSQLAVASAAGVAVENPDGTGARQLVRIETVCTTTCASVPSVAWAPDGRRIAIGGIDPKTTGFVFVDVATGDVRRVYAPRRFTFYRPIAFSPDGRLLAYTLERGNAGTASCCVTALVVARADGTRPRVVHSFGDPIHDGPGAATWSPDSTRVAFTDDGRDRRDPPLAVADVANGRLHPLPPRDVYDQSPAWSPDGRSLALTRHKRSAFTVGAGGGGFRPLDVTGIAALWLRDGDLLVATGTTGHRVAIIREARGPARTLFMLPGRAQLLSIREAR